MTSQKLVLFKQYVLCNDFYRLMQGINYIFIQFPILGGSQVPPELCTAPLDMSSELALLLPTNKMPGICSTALAGLLIRTHNEFMETYNNLKGNDKSG